jgi:FKBP-type peptidyl-prolyl cis-trans isomerase
MKTVMALVGAMVVMLAQGCATILNDATQPVAFSSDPQGAIVTVNGAAMGRTPCTLPIARKGWDKEILFTLDGYKPLNFKLKNSLDGAVAGNIIAPVIGTIVDGISGRGGAYQESVQVVLAPNESDEPSRVIEVDFKAKNATQAKGAPPVPAGTKSESQAATPGTTTTAAVSIMDLSPGEGRAAERGDEVEYRYICKLSDGTIIFDSDAADGKTRKRLAGANTKPVGLGEALIGTRAGMIRKATVPPGRAYGARGNAKSKIPPNATLIFDIRVVSVNDPPMP